MRQHLKRSFIVRPDILNTKISTEAAGGNMADEAAVHPELPMDY